VIDEKRAKVGKHDIEPGFWRGGSQIEHERLKCYLKPVA
jgi:hypothetical protein